MKNRSDHLLKLDKKHVWHPFTQMQDWQTNDQLIIERGNGIYLYDTDGHKYIDLEPLIRIIRTEFETERRSRG